MKKIGAFLLDILFPRRCAWCGAVVGFAGSCACAPQVEALRLPQTPLVQTLPPQTLWLTRAFACFLYEGPVRDAVLRLKFGDEPQLGQMLGEELCRRYENGSLAGAYDVVVPVPVSKKTLRKRGYNQSLLLAKPLAKASGLPLQNALHKVTETAAQRTLDRQGRLVNVKGAYAADAEMIAGQRVLLVDDIYTTGSTLNECAGTLLAAGAAECGALCLAAAQAQTEPEEEYRPGDGRT